MHWSFWSALQDSLSPQYFHSISQSGNIWVGKNFFFSLVQSLCIQIFPLLPLFSPLINYTTFIQLLVFLFSCLFFASFISGQSVSSVPQLRPTLWDPMDRSTPGLPVHHQLPELTQTHVHWVSDAIQPSHPLLSPSPPTFNLSQHQGLFQWVSSSHQVAKVLQFSFNISPSNEYSRLISFRMDWLDLLAVQGTLKSLLQHDSSKASILKHPARTSIHDYWKNHSFD